METTFFFPLAAARGKSTVSSQLGMVSAYPTCKQNLPAALLGGFRIRLGSGGQLDHFVVVPGLIQHTRRRQPEALHAAPFFEPRLCQSAGKQHPKH